jgi:hypothetical protein
MKFIERVLIMYRRKCPIYLNVMQNYFILYMKNMHHLIILHKVKHFLWIGQMFLYV